MNEYDNSDSESVSMDTLTLASCGSVPFSVLLALSVSIPISYLAGGAVRLNYIPFSLATGPAHCCKLVKKNSPSPESRVISSGMSWDQG